MKTLMFYSYKGGSGRTVAAANVAAAFAKLGKRTAIIDLDFEAPGLHHVLGADCEGSLGIQHYLKNDIDLDQLLNDSIDMFGSTGPLRIYPTDDKGSLLYIIASTRVANVDAHDPDVGTRMKELQDSLAQRGTEFLIIDAASGVRDAYSIAFEACDEMVIFFRWSKQHVAGTLKMVEYMKLLRRMEQSKPFLLVASACPSPKEIAAVPDLDLRSALERVKGGTQDKIQAILSTSNFEPAVVFHEILESTELKWQESIVVFRDGTSDYEELAQKLLDRGK